MAESVLRVRLTPRGGRTGVSRVEGGVAYVRVTAPPVEGAANQALVGFLAGALGLRKSDVRIRSGATSREKTVALEGISVDEALAALARMTSG